MKYAQDRFQVGLRLDDAHSDRRRRTNSVLRGGSEDVRPRSVQIGSDLDFLGRLPGQWGDDMIALSEAPFRGKQIFEWIHKHQVLNPDEMNNLPSTVRQWLKEQGVESQTLQQDFVYPSEDGTTKLLIPIEARNRVETVLIPQAHKTKAHIRKTGKQKEPVTQCVSSQVGCAMGCTFCASGVAGLTRNLNAGEILLQVFLAKQFLSEQQKLGRIVFMGMGEPLHNYEAVHDAIYLLTHRGGLGFSPRKITVSTSGLIPQIQKLADDFGGKIQLAISLHAPHDDVRSQIMPINKKYPLADLLACLEKYPLPKGETITIEYTLIEGINDSVADAKALSKLLRKLSVKVNLIPMNPIDGSSYRAPQQNRIDAFWNILRESRIPVFVRKQRGDDVAAACGQLALNASTNGPVQIRGKRPKKIEEKTVRPNTT